MAQGSARTTGLLSFLWVAGVALAAQATLPPRVALAAEEKPPALEEVVVTGTLLRREDIDTPSPVTVISAEDIQNSGLTTVADVVRSISADNSGTIPTAFGLGFAVGSSGVALRGLTVNSTLVLIDGRRAAAYALADDGERSFVDLNTVPLNAVDHIEVVRDGASSLYGADAIAGVVNIILRKTYQGATTSGEVGFSEHGGGGSRRATATFGTGDLVADRFNVFVDLEFQQDDRIAVSDRGFPFNTNDLSSIGGANLIYGQPGQDTGSTFGSVTRASLGTPGDLTSGLALPGEVARPLRTCGAGTQTTTDDTGTYCSQNLLLNTDDAPSQQRVGVLTKFTVALNDEAQAYLTASFYKNTVRVDQVPRQVQISTPNNTNSIALPPTLPNGTLNPNNPFAADGDYALLNYAFGDIPAGTVERNRVFRMVGGVKGSFLDWDYDAGLVINHTALDSTLAGFPSYKGLLAAITNGTYSFINPDSNSAAARAVLAPTLEKTSTTDLDSIDFRATRTLFMLPGGPLGLGLGAEARYEAQFDPNFNPSLDVQGLGVSQTEGSRTVYAAYAELGAPIVKQLEVDVSGRYDRYGDFGGKFTPKVGFKLTPVKQLIVRGTYSQGFRAPSFAENGSSSAEGFVNYTPPASFAAAHNGDGYVQQYTLAEFTVSNPKIQPEKSDSYTFGAVFRPVDELDISADYYYIKKRNVIAQSNPAAALAAYYAGQPLPAGFTITPDVADPAAPSALARPVVVESPYVNQNSLSTDGLDIDVRVNWILMPGVRYTSEIEATKIFSWKLVLANGESQQYVGTEGPYNLSSGAGTPRYRARWTNSATFGPATVSAIAYYTSGFYMFGADVAPPTFCLYPSDAQPDCRVPSFIDVDLTGSWKFGDHLVVSGSMENVLDRKPPLDPANYAATNYNPTWSQAGIIGRFFRLGASYRF